VFGDPAVQGGPGVGINQDALAYVEIWEDAEPLFGRAPVANGDHQGLARLSFLPGWVFLGDIGKDEPSICNRITRQEPHQNLIL